MKLENQLAVFNLDDRKATLPLHMESAPSKADEAHILALTLSETTIRVIYESSSWAHKTDAETLIGSGLLESVSIKLIDPELIVAN